MGYKVEVVPAEAFHIQDIDNHAREADRVELAAMWKTPLSTMVEALQVSTDAWTALLDGKPICMFGVAPVGFLVPDHGRPWMIGTEHLERHAPLFLRRCRKHVEIMQKKYPVLVNCVAASNVLAIRWLTWLGFKVDETPVLIGVKKVPFYRFERRAA